MKAIIAGSIVALILAGGAFATGSALDPRVPGLQRQINALKIRASTDESMLNGKVDKSCVRIIDLVVRPGYVYRANDGTFIIYKAIDEFNPSIDSTPSHVMSAVC